MRIGIYGGTFNPVHYGHLRTAEEVFDKLSLDTILFIPSGRTPFDKPELVKAAHRYEMVKRGIKGNRHFRISDIEIKARGKSFSVDTIKKLKKKFRNDELYFIMGIDAFLDLPKWKHPEEIIHLACMVVISRPGYTFSGLWSSPFMKGMSRKTLRDLDKKRRDTVSFKMSGAQKGTLCRVTELNISASGIRELIMNGKNLKYLLPDSVKSYIISHNLYKN